MLEVDDVAGERDRVAAAGWPVKEDLTDRPWGLTDYRAPAQKMKGISILVDCL